VRDHAPQKTSGALDDRVSFGWPLKPTRRVVEHDVAIARWNKCSGQLQRCACVSERRGAAGVRAAAMMALLLLLLL
jgi:hypothetical protein